MGDDRSGPAPGFDPSRVFGDAAEEYASVAERGWGFASEETVAALGLRPGQRVLDVACGPGGSAIPAARAVGPSGSVLAIDAAEEMLALGRRRAGAAGLGNIVFRAGDMRDLGLGGDRFDAVVCVFGIFFVPDMDAVAASLWERVAPGGWLAITVLGETVFQPMITALSEAAARERPDVEPVFPWSRMSAPGALEGLMAGAGAAGATVDEQERPIPLSGPDDWWTVVMGSGMRHLATAIGPDAAARVREDNASWMVARGIDAVSMPVRYGRARRPG